MRGHTALAKAILNKEVTLEDVPVGAAGAWMDAIRALEAKLAGGYCWKNPSWHLGLRVW
jgi:hypothetical protein